MTPLLREGKPIKALRRAPSQWVDPATGNLLGCTNCIRGKLIRRVG